MIAKKLFILWFKKFSNMIFVLIAAISVLKYYFNMMRLLRHGTRRKSSPIDVPPIESRGGREKRNIMVRVWCLSSNLTGLGTLGG